MQWELLKLLLVFGPLLFSAGVVFVMARIYALRVGKPTAVCCIVAWSVCELAFGVSLLWLLHALELHQDTVVNWAWCSVVLVLALWLATTALFVLERFTYAAGLTFINFLAHFFVVGATLFESGTAAALFASAAIVWVTWVFCFALSFAVYVQHAAVKPLGRTIVNHLRPESGKESVRRRSNASAADLNV